MFRGGKSVSALALSVGTKSSLSTLGRTTTATTSRLLPELKEKKIAIVGGGPAGLTLARLLQKYGGLNVTVYERDLDKFARQQGATLDLHYDSGLRAIREAGLMEGFKANYRPGAERVTIADQQAKVRFREEEIEADDGGKWNDETFRPEIDRGPLRDLLMASLADGTIVWNSKFSSLNARGQGFDLTFDNGHVSYADLVIACDGANSKIRPHLSALLPIYSGVTIIDGTIYNAAVQAPNFWKLTDGGKLFAMGPHKTLILSAKGDGALNFYTGTKEPEGWAESSGINFDDRNQVLTWFRQRFSDWSDDWHELFLSEESYFVPRPQYHFALDQSWETLPNLTMIGDAAHRMPPYAGEGVNMAMLDAVELYETLCVDSQHRTIREALASFEKKMLTRTSAITEESVTNTINFHGEKNLQLILDFFQHHSSIVDK